MPTPRPVTVNQVPALLTKVIAEVRAGLGSDKLTLIAASSNAAELYAAGGLAHCCDLAQELVAAHRRGRELIGRMLARAVFETWTIAYYVKLGGLDALTAVAADYIADRQAQNNDIKILDAAARKARKKDKRAREHRETLAEHAPHLLEDEPVPPLRIESGFGPGGLPLPDWDVEPEQLPLLEVIRRLGPLTAKVGQHQTYELAYHMAYRALSTLGAHPSLWVLDAYLDDREGRGNFVHVVPHAKVPSSFDEPDQYMTLLLICHLAGAIFEDRDIPCPLTIEVAGRLDAQFGNGT